MTDSLYTDLLLDLNRHPRNKTVPTNFDIRRKERNPLCSDEIEIFLKFSKDGKVKEVGWDGVGCAVSQAAVSLLTDFVLGKTKAELAKLTNEDVLKLMGMDSISPARLGCATLGLKALGNALK